MGRALVVATKFTAVDKYTRIVKKMSKVTKSFATKAEVAFARVQRAERKLRKGIGKKLGTFGIMVGFAMLMRVVTSTIGVFADFEQANAGLAAVMNVTVQENKILADDAKRLGATTAKTATEVVGLQEALARLGFERQDVLNMTESIISGSVAMKGELADTAELVGAMVKSFDDFESINAPKIIDQMTMATQRSALGFEKLQTALPIVSGAANAAGIPFTRLLSLLGKLSDAGIDASSSSTALRNIFLDSAKKGHSYEQILENIQKNQDKLTASYDEFGKRGAVSAVILAQNLEGVTALDTALQNAGGTAKIAADKQLNTLTGRLTILRSAWEGYIHSLEDGNGKFSEFLKTTVSVITEILSLVSGTAKAGNELDEAGLKIRGIAEKALFFIKVLKTVGITLLIVKGVMFAFNVVMNAYSIIVKLVTAAQWLWNVAMSANPIGLIIIGIAALIALVTVMIVKWDTWGKHIGFLAGGPILRLLDTIKFIGEEWNDIKMAFQEEGIIGGIKRIGQTLFRLILKPLEHVVKLLEKIGIVEEGTFASMLGDFGLEDNDEKITAPKRIGGLNTEAELETVKARREIVTNNNRSTLEILNKSNNDMKLNSEDTGINLTNTLGFENG